jgi:hypothetical protein
MVTIVPPMFRTSLDQEVLHRPVEIKDRRGLKLSLSFSVSLSASHSVLRLGSVLALSSPKKLTQRGLMG